jgi:hypothetical protein
MANHTPHPLVVKLARKLLPTETENRKDELELAAKAAPQGAPVAPADLDDAYAAILAQCQPHQVPELVVFAGFLGGIITHLNKEWRLLYLDWRLLTWLLVEEEEILLIEEIDDKTVPDKRRDAIWVKADASVHKGTGPQSTQSRFLRGAFTRAGEFNASLKGGTFSPATGIFCEAHTVGCCGKYTH